MSHKQYFLHYSEPETGFLNDFPDIRYDKALCIPAFDETPDFLDHIDNVASQIEKQILLILVINQPEQIDTCTNNEKLVSQLEELRVIWKASQQIRLFAHNHFDILLIDRFSPQYRIPEKQGVGLARKIACDMAAWLYYNNLVKENQIYCSDADVIFPDNYFTAQIPVNHSAAIFNFRHSHCGDEKIDVATQLYETSLHHYVEGLKSARSNYAFHTIGSCLLVSIDHYIKVRGFPKRAGGEDFYLLNKLQKIAQVISLPEPTLTIKARLSNRVPFGTGPAIDKLIASSPTEARIFYHPHCFRILSLWLSHLDRIATENISYDDFCQYNQNIAQYLSSLSDELNLKANAIKLFNNHRSIEARKKHIHEWFDGFKTLKAVHYLRDNYFPSLSYTELKQLRHQTDNLELD